MKILILGKGGREHALAWKISLSDEVERVLVLPGNAGMALDDKIECVKGVSSSVSDITNYAKKEEVNLTIVGPENLLAEGIADSFKKAFLPIIGPTKMASQLESSKLFAKELMKKHGIPTATGYPFDSAPEAKSFCKSKGFKNGVVIKCDGLAAGKGVRVCNSCEEAIEAIDDFMNKEVLGHPVERILIEEKLSGPEVSSFALCRGKEFIFLGHACDYKRLKDGDLGPNTGGMGCYTPADWMSEIDEEKIQEIIQRTLEAMDEEKMPFEGFLFVGSMITEEGPMVLEYNVRLGDPEAQVLMAMLPDSFTQKLLQWETSRFEGGALHQQAGHCAHVVLASAGYPGPAEEMQLGEVIHIDQSRLQLEQEKSGAKIFYAGVKANEDGDLITAGGRVLGITCFKAIKQECLEGLYRSVDLIDFSGKTFRRDIGV